MEGRADKFAKERIGMTKIAKNGMQMTIIGYRSRKDIDVQFENGAIAKHKNMEISQKVKYHHL